MPRAAKTTKERVNIFDNAVLMTLRFSGIGNRATMDSNKVDTDADKDMLNVSKRLLDSPEYREIKNHRRGWNRRLGRIAIHSETSGTATFVLPLGLVTMIEELTQANLKRDADLVDEFCSVYPQRVQEAKNRLKHEFDPKEYPPVAVVRRAFSVRTSYLTLGTPESLKSIDNAIYQRERKKFYDAIEEEAQAVRVALREEMLGFVRWMVERLAEGDDGKGKAFGKPFESRLSRFAEYLDLFKHRNLTGDTDLEPLVNKAKSLLQGVNGETVKGDDFRKRLRDAFSPLKLMLDTMVETKASRRIVLED